MKKILLLILIFNVYSFSDRLDYDNCSCNGYWDNYSTVLQNGARGSGVLPDDLITYTSSCTTSRNLTKTEVIAGDFVGTTSSGESVYYFNTEITIILDVCKPLPTCDNNQTLDTSVNPPICKDNPTVPTCNSDETYDPALEECVDNNCPTHYECVTSEEYEDNTFTNTFNVLDCNNNILGQGEQRDATTDCFGNSNPDSSNNCPPGLHLEIVEVFVPGKPTYEEQLCVADSTQGEDSNSSSPDDSSNSENQPECSHPPSQFGYKFQAITADNQGCYAMREAYAIGGFAAGFNYPCGDGRVACMFNRVSDSNSSDSNDNSDNTDDSTESNSTVGNNDENTSTTSDDNNSSPFNTDKIVNALNDISNQIKSKGNNNHEDLTSLGNIVASLKGSNHEDLTNLNNSLGSKLDNINNSIQNIPQAESTDMTKTEDLLTEIRDIMETDTTSDEDGINSNFEEASQFVDNMLASYSDTFNSISAVINNTPTVNLSSSGTCSLSIAIYGQNPDFKEGFDLFVNYLRPIVLLIMNLAATYLLIVMAIRAYADITIRVQWLLGGTL